MVATSREVFKDKFVEISYDETNRVIIAQWIGFLKIDEVKKGCNILIDFVKKNRITKHLSDQRKLKVLSKDVQGYLVDEFFGEMGKNGLTKLAVLVSDDIFAKASVENVNQTTATKIGGITFNTFNAQQDCINWLNE